MRRKADLVSPAFMWIAVFIVALIAGTWFVRQVKPLQSESEQVEYDLAQIKTAANLACESSVFFKEYNPRTEQGTISANASSVCINSSSVSDCVDLMCPIGFRLSPGNPSLADLRQISFIYVVKEAGITLYTDSTVGDIKNKYKR